MKRRMILTAVVALCCMASAAMASSNSYDYAYWTAEFGSNVNITIPGSQFDSTYDAASFGYQWSNKAFGGYILDGYFLESGGIYYVEWSTDNGHTYVSKTFASASEARQYLDSKFAEIVARGGGVNSAPNLNAPEGPQARAQKVATEFVLASKINPLSVRKQAGKYKKPVNILQGVQRPLAQKTATSTNASIIDNSATSALRYEHRWYDDSDAEHNQVGFTLRGGLQWDRVTLDIMLPVDRVDFCGGYDFLDFSRVGLVLVPRFYLLTQEDKPLDLYFGLPMYYFHTFMDEGKIDPDHAGIGPMIGLAKDFSKCTVTGGYMMTRGFNLDGDPEVNGDSELDTHKVAFNVGVPIGDRWAINVGAAYTQTPDLPEDLDENYVTLTAGASYAIKDTWALDVNLSRDVAFSDADNLEISIGAVWTF